MTKSIGLKLALIFLRHLLNFILRRMSYGDVKLETEFTEFRLVPKVFFEDYLDYLADQ